MPQVVIGAVAVAAGSAASAAVTAIVGSTLVGKVVAATVGAVIAAGVNYAGRSILGGDRARAKTAVGADAPGRELRERRQLIRSSVAPRAIVYGWTRVAGPLVYASASGEGDRYLHIVMPLATHPIAGVRAVWINDHRVTPDQLDWSQGGMVAHGPLASKARIRWHLGSQTEADPYLVAESRDGWSHQHILRGVAYLYVRLEYDPDVFPAGLQNISAEVDGKADVFDPRTNASGYSGNTALVILDYLRSPLGLACADDEIDWDSFIVAANVCDEAVQIDANGTFHQRFRVGGSFSMDRTPLSIVEELLAACGGALVYVAGRYRLHVGAYETPTDTLTEGDLAGPVELATRPPRRELFNGVRGTFSDRDRFFQTSDFPPYSEPLYVEQDGEPIWKDIELPSVNDVYSAQRLARMLLRRHRESLTFKAVVAYRGFRYRAWQTLSVTLADFGWINKPFRIVAWTFDPDTALITLTLTEESAFSYAWAWEAAEAIGPAPDTNMPSPLRIPAPAALRVTEELLEAVEARVLTRTLLSWSPVNSPFVIGYEAAARREPEATWHVTLAPSGQTSAYFDDLPPGQYVFRVRAMTSLGRGEAAQVTARVGDKILEPPAAVENFQVQAIGGLAYVTWKRHVDADVRIGGQIEFRHSPQLTGATWASATGIGTAAPGAATLALLPLKEGTYFAKATDAGGRYSADAAAFVVRQDTAIAFTPITTLAEHPTFAGTKTNTVVASGTLRLDTTGSFDAIPDLDAVPSLDDLGGVYASGRYDFGGLIDLGSVRRCRLTGRVVAVTVAALDFIDARPMLIDQWLDFDGAAGNEADAWLEVRDTPDNPSGSPVWSAWRRLDASEFHARAFQFRAQLITRDAAFNIHVSELAVRADEVT